MIIVKLLGGAKRSFLKDKLEIKIDSMTIVDLLEYLKNSIPKDMPLLDMKNILVAVNGVDSSALSDTNLKDGDVISIIPLVHGGSTRRIIFKIGISYVELIRLQKINYDPIGLLETLRSQFPDLIIQGIRSKYIVSIKHAKNVIQISLASRTADVLLSNKIETDILMRFAFTKQIDDAIKKIGLEKGQDAILIVIGKKSSINKLYKEIKHLAQAFDIPSHNSSFLKKEYLISKKQLDCTISKKPLEDLMSEKSAILFQ